MDSIRSFKPYQEFYKSSVLYKEYSYEFQQEYSHSDTEIIRNIIKIEKMEFFCPRCNVMRPFQNQHISELPEFIQGPSQTSDSRKYVLLENELAGHSLPIEFKCLHNDSHKYLFTLLFTNNTISKVGQYPAEVDIIASELNEYKNILSSNFKYLKNATLLASHNFGIGSYIYLRRIFEDIVESAHQEAIRKNGSTWDKEHDYFKQKIANKVKLLKDYLPGDLVNSKKIYSILSDGIHQYEDEKCLKNFNVLKNIILIILDDKLAEEKKLRNRIAAKEALDEITEDPELSPSHFPSIPNSLKAQENHEKVHDYND